MGLTRRQFLRGTAVSAIGAVAFTGCAARREFEAQSPARLPEDLVSGRDNWYASVCTLCAAGCGVIVRVMEGRAKKIEGNPDYPINQGKLCALGQAGLQVLYHPGRLKGPMKRTGDRGNGAFQQVSWDDALNELVPRLREVQSASAGSLVMISTGLRGSRAQAVDRFVKGTGGRLLIQGNPDELVLRTATQRVFGLPRLPDYDIEKTSFLLSFGADVLGDWLSPVRFGRGYGQLRGRSDGRGTLVQVEPRMSATAASADQWVPIRPGSEGILALSMAQVIVAEGLAAPGAVGILGPGGAASLDQYKPDQAAKATGVDAQRIADLARAFAKARPGLAVGGEAAAAQTNGLFSLSAIYALNYLVGSVGAAGGLRGNPAPPASLPELSTPSSLTDWKQLGDGLSTGAGRSVIMLAGGANPVYGLPAALKFRDSLQRAAYVVSFSSFMDESTALADLIVPQHTCLEDWGADVPDPGPGYPVLGVQQPVVQPFYDTRDFVDVLLTVADKLGGDVRRNLPWQSHRDMVREIVRTLQGAGRGSVPGGTVEEFWVNTLQRGGWWDNTAAPPAVSAGPSAVSTQPQTADFAGDAKDYPFHLYLFSSPVARDGRGAHLPWMQSLPESMTTVAWGSWIEINSATARRLDVGEGDIVRVESPSGALEVPVYVFPAIPEDVVAVPLGQGHTIGDRYVQGRGVNALEIVAPLTEKETGALAWSATRVRLTKTGKQNALAKFEGVAPPPFTETESPVQVTHAS